MVKKIIQEKKIYEVYYKGIYRKKIKRIIGYLVRITLRGDFVFNDVKDSCWESHTLKQNQIVKIRELREKGEAIKIKIK